MWRLFFAMIYDKVVNFNRKWEYIFPRIIFFVEYDENRLQKENTYSQDLNCINLWYFIYVNHNLMFYNNKMYQEDENRKENTKARATWDHSLDFLMSCIAMSVGLGNIWRYSNIKLLIIIFHILHSQIQKHIQIK